jgi:hypothetical protein
MSEPSIEISSFDGSLEDHPAILAWQKFSGERFQPAGIEIFKEQQKSCVYRLFRSGPGAVSIIAKRSMTDRLSIEILIYEEILPRLPGEAVRCYGSILDTDENFTWIFLDDAGDDCYRKDLYEDRILMGQWLGAFNVAASELPVTKSLPDRGPAHYLGSLEYVRQQTLSVVHSGQFTSHDNETFESIARSCDHLIARWDRVQDFWNRIPLTLVHGDLVEKNLRIRSSAGRRAVLPIDWETAGRGHVGADLAPSEGDPASYSATIRSRWPNLPGANLEQIVTFGKLFRVIAALRWVRRGVLIAEWYGNNIKTYEPGQPIEDNSAALAQWYAYNMNYYEPLLAAWARSKDFAA